MNAQNLTPFKISSVLLPVPSNKRDWDLAWSSAEVCILQQYLWEKDLSTSDSDNLKMNSVCQLALSLPNLGRYIDSGLAILAV
jgi:hypothetical protein